MAEPRQPEISLPKRTKTIVASIGYVQKVTNPTLKIGDGDLIEDSCLHEAKFEDAISTDLNFDKVLKPKESDPYLNDLAESFTLVVLPKLDMI